MNELVLTYVPESEHLTYDEAQALAEKRDRQAASEFGASVPITEKLLSPDELIAWIAQDGFRPSYTWEPVGEGYRVRIWDSL